MYEEILIQNGFSKKEAKVYLATLEYGEATISMIARKTKIERPTVYDIAEDLKKRGIILFQNKKGIKHISALSPQILFERFKDNFKRAESIFPDLINMAFHSPIKPKTRFYEGLEGIKEVLQEFSYSKEDTFIFTDYETMPTEMKRFLWEKIIPERKHKKSFAHLLVPANKSNELEMKKDDMRFAEHRLVRFPLGQLNPMELSLFGKSTVAFISYSKKEMFAFVIDSPGIYQALKNIFWFVWENSKK